MSDVEVGTRVRYTDADGSVEGSVIGTIYDDDTMLVVSWDDGLKTNETIARFDYGDYWYSVEVVE